MWQKIDSLLMQSQSLLHNIITDDYNNPQGEYEITAIQYGYILAVNITGKSSLKFFPLQDLLNGIWWIKDNK